MKPINQGDIDNGRTLIPRYLLDMGGGRVIEVVPASAFNELVDKAQYQYLQYRNILNNETTNHPHI
jgi:hypothetical protein